MAKPPRRSSPPRKRTAAPIGDDRSAAEPRDPLILPFIYELARGIQTGLVVPGERPPIAGVGNVPMVPRALARFIVTREISELVEAVEKHSTLYGHPLVWQQTVHLLALRSDQDASERNGWKPQFDVHGYALPPREIDTVNKLLESLIAAHARACFPSRRIIWERRQRQSGPRAGLPNDHPVDDATEFIDAHELFESWCALRDSFQTKQLRYDHLERPQAVEHVRQLAADALDASGIRWSALWASESGDPPVDLPTNLHHHWRLGAITRWQIDLLPIAEAVVHDRLPERVSRDGRLAALGYAILAALLGVAPERVRDVIHNLRKSQHQRKRRTPRRRPPSSIAIQVLST
jgi:hypothetical protein